MHITGMPRGFRYRYLKNYYSVSACAVVVDVHSLNMSALCPYEVTYKHLSGSSWFLEWALPLGAATSC